MNWKLPQITLILLVIFLSVTSNIPAFNAAANLETKHGSDGKIAVPVLIYHRVLSKPASPYDLSPEQLEEHFRYLKENGYQPITASQFVAWQNKPKAWPDKPVVLTFDDGHKSHYLHVFPLLKKYGFTATFFVNPYVISHNSDTQITWAELQEMAGAGMDIQSHTMSHPYLTKMHHQEDQAKYIGRLDYEIKESRLILEKNLGRKVDLLAYPYGWFNTTVESRALAAGYRAMFTVNWGNNFIGDSPLRIKRHVMESGVGLKDLEEILTARPLKVEILAPTDAAIVTQIPNILFRLPGGNLESVELRVRNYKITLTPDHNGNYLFGGITELTPGYHMIILKGRDAAGNLYLGSWGFDYEPPALTETVKASGVKR